MTEPFLGEVKMMSFNFPPSGWARCDGQAMPINQNQALFALVGTIYGGDGQTTFALPDLRGRTPIHRGDGFTIGQSGGETSHTLSVNEIPAHTHTLNASSDTANTPVPANARPAATDSQQLGDVYSTGGPNASMAEGAVSETGGGQAHPNMQPYRVVNFCIALQGIFPSQN